MQNSHKWLSRFRLKSNTWVYVPTLETVIEGNLLKQIIEYKWRPPSNYYHLRDGGHVGAMKYHLDGKFFVHADLKKFFNNINRSRITRELKPYFGYDKARSIAMESTVSIPLGGGQTFALPFGFVQSTIIASLCLHKSTLGKVIHKLNKIEDIKVSVYVDDIIVSAQSLEQASYALSMIQESSERSGLALNEKKLKGPAAEITAFNVDLSHNSMMISKSRFDELCLDYQNSSSENQRNGIFGYVNSICPAQAVVLTT
jgi:hypothetical protein